MPPTLPAPASGGGKKSSRRPQPGGGKSLPDAHNQGEGNFPTPTSGEKQKSGRPGARSFDCLEWRLDRGPIAADEADHPQEEDGADERRNEAEDQSAAAHAQERPDEPTADERTNDADDDVHENAVAVAADDAPGQGTRETADDQEDDEFHACFLLRNVTWY